MTIAAVVLTYNEEENIVDCLSTLSWADRLFILDSFSTDRTVALAQEMGAELRPPAQRRPGMGGGRLDLLRGCRRTGPSGTGRGGPGGHGGWPSRGRLVGAPAQLHLRAADPRGGLVSRLPVTPGAAGIRPMGAGERAVHEIAIVDGLTGYLCNPLIHYNYDDLADFIARQKRYTDYDAAVLYQEGVRPHFYTPYSQAVRHFWWRFVALRGVRDGWHGLRLSLLMAYFEAVKYRKLARLWAEKGQKSPFLG